MRPAFSCLPGSAAALAQDRQECSRLENVSSMSCTPALSTLATTVASFQCNATQNIMTSLVLPDPAAEKFTCLAAYHPTVHRRRLGLRYFLFHLHLVLSRAGNIRAGVPRLWDINMRPHATCRNLHLPSHPACFALDRSTITWPG